MKKRKLEIEYIATSELKPYEGNAKVHTSDQIQQIMGSIEAFGFNDPIAVWKKNEIIEGHGRLLAAQELGLKEVPIIRLDKLTDEERRAYTLVHNQLTLTTSFDIDKLIEEIQNIDIDMTEFGFEEPELEIEFEEDQPYGFERERTYEQYNLKGGFFR